MRIKKYIFKKWLLFFSAIGLLVASLLMIWISTLKLPDFKLFTERKIQSSTKIYDRTGTIVLYDVHQDIKRTVVPSEDININIKNATVAIEDSTFYQHKGIRISSIFRATIWAKITGRKVQGGSTITQQLIKNTLLTSQRTLTRKVKEWILAIKLEKILNKDEILTLYLNEAPYGGNIYGIEEASKAFFAKSAYDLTLAESAYLAAIPNGPTYYSPHGKHRDKLEERKNLVLKRMLELNFITEEVYTQTKNEVVVFLPPQPMHIAAPHFVFFIKDYVEKRYGENAVTDGGLKVITTLDYNLQKKAEEIAIEKAKENEINWNGKNTAIVVMDPKTGQILSMVGSRNYFDKSIDGNFNVATAERQPGSSFKPIVYALAIEKGYTDETVLFDVKTEFNSSCDPEGNPLSGTATCYSPSNYDDSFRGPISLRDALAQSINVIAVKLLYLVGIPDTIKLSHSLGISTLNDPDRYGLSLVIGGGETTLLDMASVYSVFANNGNRSPYQGILSIEDGNGVIREKYEDKSYKVLNENTTKVLSSILSDNKARTPTFGANSILVIPGRDVAVKTGTTNNNKDAWTIGYTPSVVVGVWVGNNDNIPMKKGGAALAGPIWNAVMSEALKNTIAESFSEPDPINTNIPPILRGFWQGGETFLIDKISKNLATMHTPQELIEEISITNVHTILYWINKNNPLVKSSGNIKDSQFNNWEYGVSKWWLNNKYKYNIITNFDKPTKEDDIHTAEASPILKIQGLEREIFDKNETINITLDVKSKNPIKKIDIFINNIYLTSLKEYPFNTSFIPENINNLANKNTVYIVGYDTLGNKGEITSVFEIDNL